MGLLGSIIAKGVVTAAKNSTIKAVGVAAATVIGAKAAASAQKEDVIVKNGTKLIKPSRSHEEYYGENVVEIARELLGLGFENITLKPSFELREKARKDYGKISSISINGNSEFLGVKKVPSTTYIVIEYREFKTNVGQAAYYNLTKIVPGTVHNLNELESMYNPQNMLPQPNAKNFCLHCGTPLPTEAKFCSNCGQSV